MGKVLKDGQWIWFYIAMDSCLEITKRSVGIAKKAYLHNDGGWEENKILEGCMVW